MQQVTTQFLGYRLIPYPTGYYVVALAAPVFFPGTRIKIELPITNQTVISVKVKVRFRIHEGSILPTPGTLLEEIWTPEYDMASGETRTFSVERTTELGTIDRRDLGALVQYYDEYEGKWKDGPSEMWDDVYFVRPEYKFVIGTPTITAV